MKKFQNPVKFITTFSGFGSVEYDTERAKKTFDLISTPIKCAISFPHGNSSTQSATSRIWIADRPMNDKHYMFTKVKEPVELSQNF